MKTKIVTVIIIVLVMGLLLSGCGGYSLEELPDHYSIDEVLEYYDYDYVKDYVRDFFKDNLWDNKYVERFIEDYEDYYYISSDEYTVLDRIERNTIVSYIKDRHVIYDYLDIGDYDLAIKFFKTTFPKWTQEAIVGDYLNNHPEVIDEILENYG